jgi:MFS family permease
LTKLPPVDKSKEEKPSGMHNVLMLGLVRFFTDFSTEMVLGVLPTFIVNSLGTSRTILGTIEGSAELTSYAFRLVSGTLSDITGKRKVFVLLGYGLSTISKPFFMVAGNWLDAFAVRAMDRIGKGIRTAPRDALIADSVSESVSGRAFGVHRTLDQVGAIAGPIVAFAILQAMGMQSVFLLSLMPGGIAVIILVLFVCQGCCNKKTCFHCLRLQEYGRLAKRKQAFCHTCGYHWSV